MKNQPTRLTKNSVNIMTQNHAEGAIKTSGQTFIASVV